MTVAPAETPSFQCSAHATYKTTLWVIRRLGRLGGMSSRRVSSMSHNLASQSPISLISSPHILAQPLLDPG